MILPSCNIKNLYFGDITISLSFPYELKRRIEGLSHLFKKAPRSYSEKGLSVAFVKVGADKQRASCQRVSKAEIKELVAPGFRKYIASEPDERRICPKSFLGGSVEMFKRFIMANRKDLGKLLIFPLGCNNCLVIYPGSRRVEVYYRSFEGFCRQFSGLGGLLENTLRSVTALFDSLILHCAALEIGRKGYLFLGESGSGKTTLSRIVLKNCKDSRIVSDDEVILSWDRKERSFFASRYPFDKRRVGFNRRINRIKVERVFFIKKSDRAGIREFDKILALRRIMKGEIKLKDRFKWNDENCPRLVLRLVNLCNPRLLLFPKSKEFIKYLSEG